MVAPSIRPPAGLASAPADSREDIFGFDPAFRDRVKGAFVFLHDRYFRVEATGTHHIPATGPAIFVANHSGALPIDGAMLVTTVDRHSGRALRFLYDRFVENLGPVSTFYKRVGGVVASRENALAVLRAGEPMLLFPEGVPGVAKSFGDRYRLRGFSPGFARLALALDVPIIPVAVVGAEEIYPVIGRIEGIGRLLGAPYVPFTPFFPLLGPLGAIPLPTKWFIRFGKPIRLPLVEGELRWQRARSETIKMRRKIQAMVTRLRARRQSVFFG